MANEFIARKGLIALSDSQITGSLSISESLTLGGNLTINNTGDYLVDPNRYAFRYSADTDAGLYFNASAARYEFRDLSANSVFSVGATNGNTIIGGTLSIPGFSDVSASLAAAVAGGDNLGNHTATQNLNMGGYSITNINQVDGIDVSTLSSNVQGNSLSIVALNAATSSYVLSINSETPDGFGDVSLSTSEISEGSNLYYTDTRVKTKLNTEGVISSSAQLVILPNVTQITGSDNAAIEIGTYNFGYEFATSFPVTGSGIIIRKDGISSNNHPMLKIGDVELLDMDPSFEDPVFLIRNVDRFLVTSGSEPADIYSQYSGRLFEHDGNRFSVYVNGGITSIMTVDSASGVIINSTVTSQRLQTGATIDNNIKYLAGWSAVPGLPTSEVQYIPTSSLQLPTSSIIDFPTEVSRSAAEAGFGSGGGGGASALNDLSDVNITGLADGDLLRYNGIATEWQNTNLGLSLTPTLSMDTSFYFPGNATISNYGSYTLPSVYAEVKLDGNVLVPNSSINHDGNGYLNWNDPSGSNNTGSRVLEVQVQDFGDLASEIASASYTVTEATFRYYRFETTTASSNTYVRDFRVYTDSGQGGTSYPPNMTSDTAPSPYVASSNGSYSATYTNWKAFDNSPTSTGWWNLGLSPYSGDWLQIDLGSNVTVKSARLIFNATYKNFSVGTLYGSTTGDFTGEEEVLAVFDNSLNTRNIG